MRFDLVASRFLESYYITVDSGNVSDRRIWLHIFSITKNIFNYSFAAQNNCFVILVYVLTYFKNYSTYTFVHEEMLHFVVLMFWFGMSEYFMSSWSTIKNIDETWRQIIIVMHKKFKYYVQKLECHPALYSYLITN